MNNFGAKETNKLRKISHTNKAMAIQVIYIILPQPSSTTINAFVCNLTLTDSCSLVQLSLTLDTFSIPPKYTPQLLIYQLSNFMKSYFFIITCSPDEPGDLEESLREPPSRPFHLSDRRSAVPRWNGARRYMGTQLSLSLRFSCTKITLLLWHFDMDDIIKNPFMRKETFLV